LSELNEPIRRQLHPAFWPIHRLYKWLVVIPTLLLSTFILGSLITIFSIAGFADFASRVLATTWARLNALVTLMSIDIEGQNHIQPGQSYVIVANHQSLLDIYVLYGYLGLDVKWVMKKELRSVPVLGMACEAMGHIIVDRSNTEAALESINLARDRIRDGMCVIFFPEGTRSRDGSLLPFKKGAFRLAMDLGIPILPVSIHETNKILPSDTLDWLPGKATLRIHAPITTTGKTSLDVTQLSEQAFNVIDTALK